MESAISVRQGDCREVIKSLADASVDACVTDPPYALQTINKRFAKVGRNDKTWSRSGPHQRTARGFMNQSWDTGVVAFSEEFWREVYRALKPGAHLAAFGGTRTYHRLTCAIEDAGFEIRDQIGWAFGSGFPKSHNVGSGWGTALKPAWQPICLARKPLIGTVSANVLERGTGALNIDDCRIPTDATLGRNNHGRVTGTSYVVQRENRFIDNSTGKGDLPRAERDDG